MSELDTQILVLLKQVFLRLREEQFNLGMSEYLAAVEAVKGGWGAESREKLGTTLKLLWCNSLSERVRFEAIWQSFNPKPDQATFKNKNFSKEEINKFSNSQKDSPPPTTQPKPNPVQEEPVSPKISPIPVQAPCAPALSEKTTEIQNYWPVSRRTMVYTWRYLRRPEPDGIEDVLDIEATVEQAVQQGFFLAPVYRRRESNYAHLLLLVDQDGSMVPFHRFTRDLVETALYESQIQKVDVFYFHNIPDEVVYRNPHLTDPILLEKALTECTNDTSVLIVSDAGAARGRRNWERIRQTTKALFEIQQYTTLIAWLNPMPNDRWDGTSAEFIALSVPMFQMDREGLGNAIDIVRGQPLQIHH